MARLPRYEDVRAFSTAGGGRADFPGLRPRFPGPAAGVLEHIVAAGDRLDLLALHYYNDVQLWWRILDANPELLCAADLADSARVGSVILIPAAREPGASP